MQTANNPLLPLVPFSILFALSLQPCYGYQLIQQVEQDSRGHIRLGPGALYGALKTLRDEGFIEEMPFDDEHDRRRYYRITRKGWNRLNTDLEYFRHLGRLIPGRRPFNE